jgi:hypothetical protein
MLSIDQVVTTHGSFIFFPVFAASNISLTSLFEVTFSDHFLLQLRGLDVVLHQH